MNTINWTTWLLETRRIEDAIWARQREFETRFCHGNELIHVHLTSESVKSVFLTRSGQHVTDSIHVTQLMGFLDEVTHE